MADPTHNNIWKPKSVHESLQVYADWAPSYDADVRGWGYATPKRIAQALSEHLPEPDAPILDYGCGTGLSGLELRSAGFMTFDGTDISKEMLDAAAKRGIYRDVWQSKAGDLDVLPGTYRAITAMGVISLGAAPPETMDLVLNALAPGGLLALSYNDPTLDHAPYLDKLDEIQRDGAARLLFDEYGDHLPGKDMKSHIYIFEKT